MAPAARKNMVIQRGDMALSQDMWRYASTRPEIVMPADQNAARAQMLSATWRFSRVAAFGSLGMRCAVTQSQLASMIPVISTANGTDTRKYTQDPVYETTPETCNVAVIARPHHIAAESERTTNRFCHSPLGRMATVVNGQINANSDADHGGNGHSPSMYSPIDSTVAEHNSAQAIRQSKRYPNNRHSSPAPA